MAGNICKSVVCITGEAVIAVGGSAGSTGYVAEVQLIEGTTSAVLGNICRGGSGGYGCLEDRQHKQEQGQHGDYSHSFMFIIRFEWTYSFIISH